MKKLYLIGLLLFSVSTKGSDFDSYYNNALISYDDLYQSMMITLGTVCLIGAFNIYDHNSNKKKILPTSIPVLLGLVVFLGYTCFKNKNKGTVNLFYMDSQYRESRRQVRDLIKENNGLLAQLEKNQIKEIKTNSCFNFFNKIFKTEHADFLENLFIW